MPAYGELGRYSLSIKIKQRMVRYWTRILKGGESKLNKVMCTILYNLHCKNVGEDGASWRTGQDDESALV